MTDTKSTLLLCLFCAVLASIGRGTAGYARGNSCVWGEAEERVAEMREIVRGL